MGPYTFSYLICFTFWLLDIFVHTISWKMLFIYEAPITELSQFDHKIKEPHSKLGTYFDVLVGGSRINAIIFLIFLGIKTEWWLPFIVYGFTYVLTPKLIGLIPAKYPELRDYLIMIIGTVAIPLLIVALWVILFAYI
jgi:hypothetical protein